MTKKKFARRFEMRNDRMPEQRVVDRGNDLLRICAACLVASAMAPAHAQQAVKAELTKVEAKPLLQSATVTGELQPYQSVDIHAKVTGFVKSIEVDRGSRVKQGQLLAEVTAPELEAQRAEALARIPSIEAQKTEVEAKLAAAQATLDRLKEAAKTPGVVAGNDIIQAEKVVEAERARAGAMDKNVEAVNASVRAIEEIEKYLKITAPFSGVITDRFAHPGSLVGPEGREREPLLRLQQVNRLRLVAAVPEAYTESIRTGMRVDFTVPAYPSQKFSGVVARPAFSFDPKTRTMPVELDVNNSSGRLSPGMYAELDWPVRRRGDSLMVPKSAVKSTTERTFVVRVTNGKAEWVDVRRGMAEAEGVEVFGALHPGDTILLRASDEIRPGTPVQAR